MSHHFASSPSTSSQWLRWCLGVGLWMALLLAQQAGWHHELSHVGPAQPLAQASIDGREPSSHLPERGELGHGDTCQACLAFHAGAQALPAATVALLLADGKATARPDIASANRPAITELGYQSRAPPFRC